MLVLVGKDETELLLNVSIALKNPLEGNMGDQEKLHLLCLSSYDSNYCLMNTLDACTDLLSFQICWREVSSGDKEKLTVSLFSLSSCS